MDETTQSPAELVQAANQKDAAILENMTRALEGGLQQAAPQETQPPPQPETPPAQGNTQDAPPAYSAAPVTREGLHGMFSDPETKPVETQTEELPPDNPIPEPENLTDRGRNAFAELRSVNKQLRTSAENYQRQIADLKAAQEKFAAERDQLTAALKERDDQVKMANEKLGRMDLSGSIEFRQRFDEPLQQAEANLDTAVESSIGGPGGETLSAEEVVKVREHILQMDDDKFRKYISTLGLDAQAALIEKRRTCQTLSAERKRALDDWQATSKGLSSIAASEHAADRALSMRRAADEAIVFNTQTLPRDKRALVLGDPYFAEDVAAANDEFRAFMQTAKEKEIARAVHAGMLLPVMNRALVTALEAARDAQEQLAKYRGIMHPGTYSSPRADAPARRAAPLPTTPAERQQALAAKDASIEGSIAETLAAFR